MTMNPEDALDTIVESLRVAESQGEIRGFVAEPLRYYLLKSKYGEALTGEEREGLYRFSASSNLGQRERDAASAVLMIINHRDECRITAAINAYAGLYARAGERKRGSGRTALFLTSFAIGMIWRVAPKLAGILTIVALAALLTLLADWLADN